MKFILIYDTGKQYAYYYDPKDLPEWLDRYGICKKVWYNQPVEIASK